MPCCNWASYFCYSKDQLANVGPAGKHKKHSMFTIIGVSPQQSTLCCVRSYSKASRLHCYRQAMVQAIFTIVKTSWQTWDQLANIQSTLYSKNSTPCCHGASYFCYSKDQLANVGPAGKYKKHPMFTIIGVSPQQSTLCCVRS